MEYFNARWRSEPQAQWENYYLYVRLLLVFIFKAANTNIRLHLGKSSDVDTFEEFLGSDTYEECITSTFDDYLNDSYCKLSQS